MVTNTCEQIIPTLDGDGIALEQNPYELQQNTYRCKICGCGSFYVKKIYNNHQIIQCQNCNCIDAITLAHNPTFTDKVFELNQNQIREMELTYKLANMFYTGKEIS